jgi:hypothetical protein
VWAIYLQIFLHLFEIFLFKEHCFSKAGRKDKAEMFVAKSF